MKKSGYEIRLDEMMGLSGEKEFCSFKFDDSSDYAFFSVEYEKPADKDECRNAIISMLDGGGMYPVDRYDIKTMVEDCSEGFYYSWLVSDDDYPTRDSIKQKLKKHPKMKSMFVMTEGDVTLIDVNNFFDIVEEAADDVFSADSIDYIIQGKYRPKKRNKKRCSIFCFCDSKAVCDKGRVYDKYELEVTCYKKILEIQDEEPQIHSDLNKKWNHPEIKVKICFSDEEVPITFKAPTKRQIFSNLNQMVEEISGALKSGDIMCGQLDEIINRIKGKVSESDSISKTDIDPSLSDDVKQLRKLLSEYESPDDAAGNKLPYWKSKLDRIHSEMRIFSTVRLGEFRSSRAKSKTGTITLYTTAIADSAKAQNLPFETVFFSTLIHEYFHALHYQLFKQLGIEDRWAEKWCDDERRIVQETLAAFYEWYRCRYDFFLAKHPDADKRANQLMADWESLDIDLWPYSGALVLAEPDNNRPPLGKLFFWLLETSFNDWVLAAKAIKALYYLPQTGLGEHDLKYYLNKL